MSYSTTAWRGVVLEYDHANFVENRGKLGTQEEVASLLGITYQKTISEIECGYSQMDNRTYSLFLLLANCHPSYELISEKGENLSELVVEYEGAEKFKQYRKNAELLQRDVASLLCLTNNKLVSRYESNKQNPSSQCYTLFLLITNQHPCFSISRR